MPISDLARSLSRPILAADDLESMEQFFRRPEVGAFLTHARNPANTAAALRDCADLLPQLHPSHAAALALMGGSLVEGGADPAILFPTLHALLRDWLQRLRPFCAQEVEEDDEEVEETDRQAWTDAQARLAAVPQDAFWEVEALQAAVDVLVLPMMTMLLRHRGNHQAFIADDALMALLYAMTSLNDSLPFDQLHFLWLASRVSYEDELVVVLPASGTGFIAEAHAINNTFHALTLLQILIGEHAQALRVQRDIASRTPDMDGDTADFQWLQAGAYAGGELKNMLKWAWGEAALRDHPSRHGKRVLIALETDEGTQRNWSGFNGAIHEAQKPSMTFKRYLTPEEVASYLA
ncbi:hypothetical protein [Achromobacter sp.]|uniref:hypothetical protein n=1 Tax=Achromobacter sp. TaxID=134375 RepID=UPI0031DBC6B5